MKDIFEKCYRETLPSSLRKMNLFPYFKELQSKQDCEVIMDGKRRIMMGSNNYLGLTVNPEVNEAAMAALIKYGTGCSGSRLLNGSLPLHSEFENEIAEFLHKEAGMVFSTGFQSNLGIISGIVGKGDWAICDKEDHASIIDGVKLSFGKLMRFKHNDMEDLERILKKVPEDVGAIIIVDGIYSMSGEITDLRPICKLARQYGARVMVDDAHSFGVIGEGGRGTASYWGVEDDVDVMMGTFSKSLASLGGYMVCKAGVIEYMKTASRPFIFSAAATPTQMATALASLRYLKKHPELSTRLLELSEYLRKGLKSRGIRIMESITPIVPIYTYEPVLTLKIQQELYERGVYVNAALPPSTPPDGCLLRCSLMASFSEALIDEACDIIADVISHYDLPYKQQ